MTKGRRAWIGTTLLALAGCGVAAARVVPAGPAACEGERSALVVEAEQRTMTVCEDGRVVAVHGIRLGRAGTGKTREGDERTPSGRYALGSPVRSHDFGTFIPVGYPTAAQMRAGYTGSAVGVHGPSRRVRWLGPLVNVFDTTEGCVGLATDEETTRVATWVLRHPGAVIVIR